MKKATRSEKQGSQSQGQINTQTPIKAPSKIYRVLAHLVSGETLNRFEAERIGDHCLNSTISDLSNSYGLLFTRTPEKVSNRWGIACDVIRYSLPPSELERASNVLALLNRKPAKVVA